MKKILFILSLFFLVMSISAEAQIYDLDTALENLDVKPEQHPENLPGAGIIVDGPNTPISDQIKKSGLMGKPYIITYYIQKIANALTGLVAAIAVLFIIQNSFNLLTSAGGSEMITKAKKGLMWSLIGLVVIIGAYIVVKTAISLPYAGEGVPDAQPTSYILRSVG